MIRHPDHEEMVRLVAEALCWPHEESAQAHLSHKTNAETAVQALFEAGMLVESAPAQNTISGSVTGQVVQISGDHNGPLRL